MPSALLFCSPCHAVLCCACCAAQVRVYSLASCLQHPGDPAYTQPIRCHRMASKLSSLAWNPDAPGAVTGERPPERPAQTRNLLMRGLCCPLASRRLVQPFPCTYQPTTTSQPHLALVLPAPALSCVPIPATTRMHTPASSAAVADYDGVVSQVDMESGHLIAEADEHAGRCGRAVLRGPYTDGV